MTDDSLIAFLKWRLPAGRDELPLIRGIAGQMQRINNTERSQADFAPSPPLATSAKTPQRQKESHVKTQPATLRVAMRALAPRCKEKTDSEQELTEVTESSVSCFSSCAKSLLGCEKKKDGVVALVASCLTQSLS